MKRIAFIIAFICIAITSQAQVSGYLGKRFSIDYDLRVFPAINPTLPKDIYVNFTHRLTFQYVLTRKTALELRGTFIPTAMEVSTTVLGGSIGAGAKFFIRRHIAPLGWYWAPHLEVNIASSKPSAPAVSETDVYPSISLAVGRTYVVKDFLKLGVAVESHLNIINPGYILGSGVGSSPGKRLSSLNGINLVLTVGFLTF